MAMSHDGLTKLIEECGEVIQVAAKMQAFPNTDKHPDGKGSLKERLEDELADLIAAIAFVSDNLSLNDKRMLKRSEKKRTRFENWDKNQEV